MNSKRAAQHSPAARDTLRARCLRRATTALEVKAVEAVFAAYGWPGDLSDEELLEKLLVFGFLRFIPFRDAMQGVLRKFREGEVLIQPLRVVKLLLKYPGDNSLKTSFGLYP